MRALVLAALLVGGAVGCGAGASPDPGLGALLQISGAQYRPGALPSPSGGPDAIDLLSTHSSVTIGDVHERITGALGPGSRSAVIGIVGVDGAWILPAGVPAFETPDDPSVSAVIGLADDFPPGPFTLTVFGGDELGRFGAPAAVGLTADAAPVPTGELVVGLIWTAAADLDLHVVDPLGGEAWSGKPNTLVPPPPGTPVDPNAYLAGGILDHDGNADCHRDGRPNEHVIWTMPPPTGNYIVRVEARSMCGAASADWYVAAYRNGALIGAARGVSTPDDVSLDPHGAGAGVLALRFTL